MRQLPSSVAAATVLVLLTATAPRAVVQAPPSLEGYPAVGTPPTVKLISPGAEPRTPLRYRLAANYKDSMTMSMAMGMAMTIGEMSAPETDLPLMKMTADVAVTGVSPNGDITYTLVFTGMSAEPRPGVDPAMIAAVQQSAAGITGMKGTITLTDRGVNRAAKIDAEKADPTLRQMMDSLSTSLESMSMPMPEEAVGVGARWEVRQAIRSGGMALFQRSECELVSMQKNAVQLRMKMDQNAPRQSVSNPALPPGATMEVEKVTGSGSGTMTVRLDGLIPTAELSSASNALMTASLAGQSQRMVVDTRMKVTIASGK